MKICVLQPDYTTTNVDYKNYDPPRNLTNLRTASDVVDHVFLNKLTTHKQLKALSLEGYDIFVNLCEGYLEWEVPSIDVINSLDILNLPYTGPNAILYDPPKTLMKYVAYCAGVKTPNAVEVNRVDKVDKVNTGILQFPLFVKPAKAGDSLGIDEKSLVKNETALAEKLHELQQEYPEVLIEEYIAGREFTVLVAANNDGKTCKVYKPVEYVFPDNIAFKTYAHKTSALHKDVNKPCNDPILEAALKDAAQKIFTSFAGVGYARLDFRVNENGDVFFLEINFTCSVFYENGYEGSADYILYYEQNGKWGFLQQIIEEGIARYNRKQRKYIMKGNSIAGYGIFATIDIIKNDIIFAGEEKAQRLVTKKYVAENWNAVQKNNFKHYAYPISNEVYILWDENAANWAPQNHSCDANTAYNGLNVQAIKNIKTGEELTLDYESFLDENVEPFICTCGSSNCRGTIQGIKNNSITARESK
jgi:D-alanine-D-alanine ligase-like ATP-grasp enzyme